MFQVNDDLSIYVTRGDMLYLKVKADDGGVPYTFQVGDVLRFKVFGKKDAENVLLQKDFPVAALTQAVEVILDEQDTKIGEVISKPKDYWYEVELNPFDNPRTIIGYDENGPKVFRLLPEGKDVPDYVPDPEVIRVIDTELDMVSQRPVQNQAIARAFYNLEAGYLATHEAVAGIQVTPQMFGAIGDGVSDDTKAFQRAVDSLGVSASRLIIPSGTYRITDSIILANKSNIQIIGSGSPVILFDSKDDAKSGFHFTNYKNIEVSGFSFKSTRDKTEYPPAGHGTVGYASSNILAIYLANGENAKFRDNRFEGMKADYWIVGDGSAINKNILVDGWISNNASMPTFSKNLDGAEFRHTKIYPATKIGAGNHIYYFGGRCKGVKVVDCECEALDNTLSCLISFYSATEQDNPDVQPDDILVKDFYGKGCRLFVGNKFAKVRFENVHFEQIYENYLTDSNSSGEVYSDVDTSNGYYGEIEMIGCYIKTINADLISDNEHSTKVLIESSHLDLGTGGLILYNSNAVIKNCDIVCGTLVYSRMPEIGLRVYVANNRITASSFIVSRRNGYNGLFDIANNVITGNSSRCLYSSGSSDGTGIRLLNNCMFNMNTTYPIGDATDTRNLVLLGNYANGATV